MRKFLLPRNYNAELNALLPSQAGNAGEPLRTDGTNVYWSDADGDAYLLNGDWEINQDAAYPFTFPAAAAGWVPSDLWEQGNSCPAATMQATLTTPGDAPPGVVNVLRISRIVGAVVGNNRYIQLSHNVTSEESRRFMGRTITFSCWCRVGAAYAAEPNAFCGVRIHTGTGTDQSVDITGFTGVAVAAQTFMAQSTTWVRLSCTATLGIPGVINQIAFNLYLEPDELNLAGVANQYFEFAGPQIDFGPVALPYRHYSQATTLEVCQRRYFKTFALNVVPVQAVGTLEGAYQFVHTQAGAVGMFGVFYPFPTRQRATPTLTTYNPINANIQPHDFVTATDCAGRAFYASEVGVRGYCVGNAASVLGSMSAAHFVADARI